MFAAATPGAQSSPAIAWNGSSHLVVWEDDRGASWDIYAARVSAAGVVQESYIAVSTAPGDQRAPAVASDGSGWLVTWQDSRSGTSLDVYAARVSASGTVLDPGGIPISTAAGEQSAPALDWNGSAYVVAWQDARGPDLDVYGTRVDATGVVSDPGGVVISNAFRDQRAPSVTAGGSTTLIAWEDFRLGSDCDVRAGIVASGSVVGADGFVVTNLPNSQFAPEASWDGTNFLVAWSDWVSAVTWDIRATRVTPAAVVLDAPFVVSNAANDQTEPSVAWEGTSFRRRTGRSSYRLGRPLRRPRDGCGTVQDGSGFVLSNAPDEQVLPAVAAAGSTVLATWETRAARARTSTARASTAESCSTRRAASCPRSPTRRRGRRWHGTAAAT